MQAEPKQRSGCEEQQPAEPSAAVLVEQMDAATATLVDTFLKKTKVSLTARVRDIGGYRVLPGMALRARARCSATNLIFALLHLAPE